MDDFSVILWARVAVQFVGWNLMESGGAVELITSLILMPICAIGGIMCDILSYSFEDWHGKSLHVSNSTLNS